MGTGLGNRSLVDPAVDTSATAVGTSAATTVDGSADHGVEIEAVAAAEPSMDWSRDRRTASFPWSGTVLEPALVAGPVDAAAARSCRRRFWRDLGIGGVFVLLIHVFLVQISVVRGLSMAPSLQDGDRLMVDRVSYSMTEVDRFDVVVLRYPRNPDVDFVKRVVGLPGDRVELSNGVLSVNGAPIREDFAHFSDVYAAGTWTVPTGQYFVLGDNRPVSCDSREFGMVSRELLKGKVRVCFWPLDRLAVF